MNRSLAIAAALSIAAPVASQPLPGPIQATVVRVVDGDTLVVDAAVWPKIVVNGISVRVHGIDTPERRGACEHEKQLAESAKLMMSDLFPAGASVELLNVQEGKFAGRVLADVRSELTGDWAKQIVRAGLAVSYFGSGAKEDWCHAE